MASASAGKAVRMSVRGPGSALVTGVSLVVSVAAGVPVSDRTADSNSRRAKASSAHIDGASAGAPGVLVAANGLRIALTAPVTNLFPTPTTWGSNGFGADAADVCTGDDWIEVIRNDVVLDGSVEPATRLVST